MTADTGGYLLTSDGEGRTSMKTEHHFAGSASPVCDARAFVSETLSGAPQGMVDDAVLIVSELAANAVTHGQSACSS